MKKLEEIVRDFMHKEGVHSYEIDLMGNSNLGDGYMGEMVFFKVVSKESPKVYDLVVKFAASNEDVRKMSLMGESFGREIYMYSTVFETISNFILGKNKGTEFLEFIPKLYWYRSDDKNEAIVLENLKTQGFKMWKKYGAVDLEHSKAVLKALAKWHGSVMAFRDQNREEFNRLVPHLKEFRFKQCLELGLVDHAMKNFKRLLKMLEDQGNVELAEKYRKFDNPTDFEKAFFPSKSENDNLVIAHSDIWINNVLFRYEKNENQPSALKLLDYQLASVNTPIDDLSFFIYGCCDETVLNSAFDNLLQEYYAELSKTIRDLGSDPDSVFTFQNLEEHWRKYGMIGVLSSFELIKIQNLQEDEVPDFRQIAENGDCSNIAQYFDITIKNQDIYIKRLLAVFTHYGNKYL